MIEIIAYSCLVAGSFFMMIAGIGMLRLPDIYMRLSATTKAATFGVGFNLLAAALFFSDLGVTSRALATIVFIFITAPVAAHVIARAAYLNKIPLWKDSICDELEGRYNEGSHELSSPNDMQSSQSHNHIKGKGV